MKCRNYKCNNTIPENREIRQTYQPSRFWFCLKCLKKSWAEPIRYKCNRGDCDNLVTWGLAAHNSAYCSVICKRRNQFHTKFSEQRPCIECGNFYMTHLGQPQKFCSEKCRIESYRLTKNKKARERYSRKKEPLKVPCVTHR